MASPIPRWIARLFGWRGADGLASTFPLSIGYSAVEEVDDVLAGDPGRLHDLVKEAGLLGRAGFGVTLLPDLDVFGFRFA